MWQERFWDTLETDAVGLAAQSEPHAEPLLGAFAARDHSRSHPIGPNPLCLTLHPEPRTLSAQPRIPNSEP